MKINIKNIPNVGVSNFESIPIGKPFMYYRHDDKIGFHRDSIYVKVRQPQYVNGDVLVLDTDVFTWFNKNDPMVVFYIIDQLTVDKLERV